MRIDLYTKIVLSVIAALLGLNLAYRIPSAQAAQYRTPLVYKVVWDNGGNMGQFGMPREANKLPDREVKGFWCASVNGECYVVLQ